MVYSISQKCSLTPLPLSSLQTPTTTTTLVPTKTITPNLSIDPQHFSLSPVQIGPFHGFDRLLDQAVLYGEDGEGGCMSLNMMESGGALSISEICVQFRI